MTTYVQDFYLYGKHIATGKCPTNWVGSSPSPPPSRLFLCKHCGQEYGRVSVWHEISTRPSPFIPYMRCCETCWLFRSRVPYSKLEVPESFFVPLDKNYVAHLPREILLWELRCLDLNLLRKPT